MKYRLHKTLVLGVATVGLLAGNAFAETELRMTWYNDGIEGEVMQGLLDKFEAANPDIKVTLDVVPYKAILESLPVQLAAGEGPDLARVTDLGGLSQYYLDLTPHISDPGYWKENFGPFLKWLDPNGEAISGFMTQLTVTGPYVNKTLFEQAGVDMPGEGATWDDWAKAVERSGRQARHSDPDGLGPFRPPRFRPGNFHGRQDVRRRRQSCSGR